MSAIKHRHVIRLLEVFETNQYLFMVLEYAEGGDLLHHLNNVKAMSEEEAKKVFKQVVFGVAHCHCRSVLHRDIKLENILIGEKGNVKLCDFGISQLINDPNLLIVEKSGTPPYMSPESFSEKGFSGFMSDIWSLGVLLYAMVCGKMPFKATNILELEQEIRIGIIEMPKVHPRSATPYSEEIISLIKSMCKGDPTTRITIPEILQHSWFSQGDSNI